MSAPADQYACLLRKGSWVNAQIAKPKDKEVIYIWCGHKVRFAVMRGDDYVQYFQGMSKVTILYEKILAWKSLGMSEI